MINIYLGIDANSIYDPVITKAQNTGNLHDHGIIQFHTYIIALLIHNRNIIQNLPTDFTQRRTTSCIYGEICDGSHS